MEKAICIHGHFYQPPRENPWLDEVEMQDTAYPYHDWNERVTAECYAPNAAARILGTRERIIEIVNNYSKISFNFGPTLLSWMERKKPEVYAAILEADRISRTLYGGHGSALAQVYNHMIMPLASRRDKETQVRWGLRDFEKRFHRHPEGMWLSETAVDLETLDILAEHAIRFTLLSAHQAKRVRKLGDGKWKDVAGGKVDPRQPYLCKLPSGRSIILFFYDNPVAHDVAFGQLLKNGEAFAQRLLGLFSDEPDMPAQLVNVATDGETYGHHHRYGDMALAYCLNYIESRHLAKISIYGEHLEKFPPLFEAEIFENTSWSCFHGVERWRGNCGCNSGLNPGYTQAWREPLRKAMDLLHNELEPVFENQMRVYVADPWQARNDYIDVILDRSDAVMGEFFRKHQVRELAAPDQVRMLKLLEMQRHAMLMYTSCGWFFDDISGIETIQVMQYAARAIQLAREAAGLELKNLYLNQLKAAPCNLPLYVNGTQVWYDSVEPSVTDLYKVSAHYAVQALMTSDYGEGEVYCYQGQWQTHDHEQLGGQKLVTGMMRVRSKITWEEIRAVFSAVHLGDHNLLVGVREELKETSFTLLREEMHSAFQRGEIPELIRLLDDYFGPHTYSLLHFFKDEQRRILDMILGTAMQEAETYFRQIYQHHFPVIQMMNKLHLPMPRILSTTVEFILNRDIIRMLEDGPEELVHLRKAVAEVIRWDFKRDKTMLNFIASAKITELLVRLIRQPEDLGLLEYIVELLDVLADLKLDLDLWEAQNHFHALDKMPYTVQRISIAGKNRTWVELFRRLSRALHVESAHLPVEKD